MKGLVNAWQDKRILVVGDPGYDVYHFGHVDRVSPEAPVPVFVEDSIEDRPGLAYNVCQNLAGLGCKPVQCFRPQPWTLKRRFMVGTHQLLRVDKDQAHKPSNADIPDLTGIYAVVFSDYAKGWMDSYFVTTILARAREAGIPTIVDPKEPDWTKYRGATVVCPNEREMDQWVKNNWGITRPANLLIKRGANGIRLEQNGSTTDFPSTAQNVFDVTGAGDTVVATVAATLAAGGSIESAAKLANLAAGYVVGKVGTAYCPAETLRDLCA